MQGLAVQEWLERGRAQVLRGDTVSALATFAAAHAEHPHDVEIALAHAGLLWDRGDAAAAESILRASLQREPGHVAATLLLARVLFAQSRTGAAERAFRDLLAAVEIDVETRIRIIELLDEHGCERAASEIAEAGLEKDDDTRLHAYAGMLAVQTGAFEVARAHYARAMRDDPRALDWHAPYGYVSSKRYASADDPDFAWLRELAQRPDMKPRSRASLLFALGKMHDDVSRFEAAAAFFREANAIAAAEAGWSRKNWRRLVATRLDARAPVSAAQVDESFRPVFVVGLPRSGTTLIADWLGRVPGACNRGELDAIAGIAQEISRARSVTADTVAHAARRYRTEVRRDDGEATWYIDKQPLNFLQVDLILALFPNARFVYCRRNARDTALSIWMQYFAGRAQDFAYDFADIEAVGQGCAKLMGAALRKYPHAVFECRYEAFVQDPAARAAELARWIGMPVAPASEPDPGTIIRTASAWQARQPVHTRSIGRWRDYAPFVPELLRFADD